MKIAQIVCTFPPYRGGIGNVAYNFTKVLEKNGHQVTVFTSNNGQATLGKYNNFNVIRLKPLLEYGHGAFIPQLLWRLNNFDIVHLHYPFFGGAEVVWLAKILFRKKLKLIIHYHMDATGLPWLIKILSLPSILIRNSLFKKAQAITCASLDYVKHSGFKNMLKKYKAKFHEIPFGVDIKKFNRGQAVSQASRLFHILFVGGLDKAHYFKGLNILLTAVARLKIKNWQLAIVGDGDLRPQYESQAKELGVGGKVNFLGGLNNNRLIKAYQNADIFVLPSINKHEAFGLVLLEALSCAVPVIASNLPGVRKVFQDKVQGLLARPGDADDLRNKIEEILSSSEKRNKMGQAGRKLVKEKYSWKKAGAKLEEVYFKFK